MISIVTINYNSIDATLDLLNSLASIKFSGEIIVVDNASTDNEAEVISNSYPNVVVIASKDNLGFAGGNNLGIERCGGSLIMLLNNDTVVKDNFEAIVESFFASRPLAGAVSPKILFEYSPTIIQYAGSTELSPITMRNRTIGYRELDTQQHPTTQTSYTHGAAMIVRRSTINDVGLMPTDYFLYYEELDWCEMMKKKGWEIWYLAEVNIYHKGSVTTGKNSPLKRYYITRNRLIFSKRNKKGIKGSISRSYQILLVAPLHIIKHLLRGEFNQIKPIIKGIKYYVSNY